MNEMKPCPFCSNTDLMAGSFDRDGYRVICRLCGAEGPLSTEEADAVRAWNERYDSD